LTDGTSLITVLGDFLAGDEKTFTTVALPLDNAVVDFGSGGGSLITGIQIGKAIRLKGFVTIVHDENTCASACAIAWLGGSRRFMSATAHVGFHAAYLKNNGEILETSVGNALVGAYLAQLGLSEGAVIYMTTKAPQDMQWLTFPDAELYGIEVRQYYPDDKTSQSSPAPEMPQPSEAPSQPAAPVTSETPLTLTGYWIQLSSRESAADAIAIARAYQANFPDVEVFACMGAFSYGSGYVVAIGPFPNDSIRDTMTGYKSAGRIPADSFIANAKKFVARVDTGSSKGPNGTPSVQAPDQVAANTWIQISGWTDRIDAIRRARAYSDDFPTVAVYQTKSMTSGAWIAVVGPYSADSIQATLQDLISTGKLPPNSYAIDGSDLGIRADIGSAPPNKMIDPLASLEQRATSFYGEIQRQWSLRNDTALPFLEATYGDAINYYGSVKGKAEVMSEKTQFAERWPRRQYSARLGTVTASCDHVTSECTISGTLDWKTFNPTVSMTSVGIAQYQFIVDFQAAKATIVGENGIILARSKTQAPPGSHLETTAADPR
jgi:hypothetical protein